MNVNWRNAAIGIGAVTALLLLPTASLFSQTPSSAEHSLNVNSIVQGWDLRWINGFLVTWRTSTTPSDTDDNLVFYDVNGNRLGGQRLWFPGATQFYIWDASASTSGNVAVVGAAFTTPDAGTGFLIRCAVQSAFNRGTVVLQTAPFEGQRVAFGGDGTIWVLGYELAPGRRRLKRSVTQFMLHHYGADGSLVDQYLQPEVWPASCGHFHPADNYPSLIVTGDRIGMLLRGCRTWMEVDMHGQILGSWPVPSVADKDSGGDVLSIAVMTAADQVYCVIGNRVFSLNRSNKQWVSPSPNASIVGGLIGLDSGSTLVISSGSTISWSNVLLQQPN